MIMQLKGICIESPKSYPGWFLDRASHVHSVIKGRSHISRWRKPVWSWHLYMNIILLCTCMNII